MNPTDIDFGNRIGNELKDTSSLHSPPASLYPRVAERERQRNRRRATHRAGAAGLAAVATIGGVAWVQSTRIATTPASKPDAPLVAPTPSANPNRIDAYPIINWPAEPVAGVGASYATNDVDQGWGGTVGVPHPGGAPTSIVAIHAFPAGWTTFSEAKPGRIPGVLEENVTNGNTTLTWNAGDIPMVVTGDDVDLMYELIDLIQPIAPMAERGGYTFAGPLPGGLVELETPYHRVPMSTPMLDTSDGTFGVSVQDGPLLNTLAGGGFTHLTQLTISGRLGYGSTTGNPTIGIAISADETLYISSTTLTIEQLIAIAEDITITDEASWTSQYSVGTNSLTPVDGTSARTS